MVQVNIEEQLWKDFMKDSIDKNTSASKRISDFIKKEVGMEEEQDDNNN